MEIAPGDSTTPSSDTRGRGRGRGRSRGGFGKYLRARGRGHRGGGRPAEFGKRLVLEGEGPPSEEDEEQAAERAAKYSRRQLGTNADRYVEPEPELGSDGEPIVEPEVDLSPFLERQRISDSSGPSLRLEEEVDEGEVDTSLAHIGSKSTRVVPDKKGKVQQVEWDPELDEMSREKAVAEAQWDLKARFKAKSEKLKAKPVFKSSRERQAEKYEQAPELPVPGGAVAKAKDPKVEMEEFLDGLIS